MLKPPSKLIKKQSTKGNGLDYQGNKSLSEQKDENTIFMIWETIDIFKIFSG